MECLADNLAALTKERITIPPMPAVLSRIMTALRDPNISIANLAKLLREDPGLAGQLLKVANSPLYGLPRRVKTLEQAVMLLGFRALRSLVVGESTRMMYARSEPISQDLWVHSRGAAVAAHVVARVCRVGNRQEAFVAGLLHDIGKALLFQAAPEEYKRADREAAERGMESHEAEQVILGMTHMEAGSLLVRQWGLSEDLEHVVRYHHDVDVVANSAAESLELVCVTTIADRICHSLGVGVRAPKGVVDLAAEPAVAELSLDPDDIWRCVDEVRETCENDKSLFE